jgi:hypothetical protein
MKTEYGGSPVAGGTYPANIWHDFMSTAIAVHDEKVANQEQKDGSTPELDPGTPIDKADPEALEAAAPKPESEKKAEAGLKKLVDPSGDAAAPAAGKDSAKNELDQAIGGGRTSDRGFPR